MRIKEECLWAPKHSAGRLSSAPGIPLLCGTLKELPTMADRSRSLIRSFSKY